MKFNLISTEACQRSQKWCMLSESECLKFPFLDNIHYGWMGCIKERLTYKIVAVMIRSSVYTCEIYYVKPQKSCSLGNGRKQSGAAAKSEELKMLINFACLSFQHNFDIYHGRNNEWKGIKNLWLLDRGRRKHCNY